MPRRTPRRLPCVVTGQQAGLFGGPLFTLGKLLGAVRLARERSERAVFWIECDDADIAEVDRAHVVGADGELRSFRLGAPDDGRPVAARRLDLVVGRVLDELEACLPPGPPLAAAMEDLRACYEPTAFWPQAFARYLARLTEGLGVTFVDPTSSELKQAAVPLLRRVLASPEQVEAAVAAGAVAVGHPQVPYVEGELPLFLLDAGGARRKLERHGTGLRLKGSGVELTRAEARELLERSPQRFSPGVLLRPIVQDFILPTTVYVAGPAEAAYHRQLGPLYELLEVERPRLVPRPRLTLVEPRTRRSLEKLGVDLETALAGEAGVLGRLAVTESGLDPAAEAAAAAREIDEALGRLRDRLLPIDPAGLTPAFDDARAKIRSHAERLGVRALDALKRRSLEAGRQARKLAALLTPLGEPQERVLNPIHFLARHPPEELVAAILEAIDPEDPGRHLVLDLGGRPR